MDLNTAIALAEILAILGMVGGWVWGFAKMKAALETNTAATDKATTGLEHVTEALGKLSERVSNLEGALRVWIGLQ